MAYKKEKIIAETIFKNNDIHDWHSNARVHENIASTVDSETIEIQYQSSPDTSSFMSLSLVKKN